jgi:hypothetical protein
VPYLLWLLAVQVHIADLRSKYQAYGLDIVEMRAIWYCLRQTNWDAETEAGVAKVEWKLGFKSKLDDLAHKEAYGTLSNNEKRNKSYSSTENLKLFDAFKPIESRYARSASYFKDADHSPSGSPRDLAKGQNKTEADELDVSFDSISQIQYDMSPPQGKMNLLTDDVSDLTISSDLMSPLTGDSNSGSNFNEATDQQQQQSRPVREYPSVVSLTPTNKPKYYDFSKQTPGSVSVSCSGGTPFRRYPATPSSVSRNKSSGWKTPVAGESGAGAVGSAQKTTMGTLYAQRYQVGGSLDLSTPAAVGKAGTPSPVNRIPFHKRIVDSNDKDSRPTKGSFSSQFSDSSLMTPIASSYQTPARSFGKILSLVSAGKATSAKAHLRTDNCPSMTPSEASVMLLKCAEDPESLAEPLDTFKLLVEDLGADVNTVDSTGKNLIQILISNPFIGGYLMFKGADILMDDGSGWCALSFSFEYGVEWMYEAFISSGSESKLLSSGDELRILKYVSCLIIGGYCTRARDILATGLVTIDSVLATELLASCRGNFDNMKEPIETFELLESLGAVV